MTNYEKIRAMSESELADFLCEMSDCTEKCYGFEYCGRGYRGTNTWLRKESEDDE